MGIVEILLVIILTIVESFVLMISYNWFIKPVFTELPNLNLAQSYGISFFIGLVLFDSTSNLDVQLGEKKLTKQNESDRETTDSVMKITYLCVMLMIAFCFHLLFPV